MCVFVLLLVIYETLYIIIRWSHTEKNAAASKIDKWFVKYLEKYYQKSPCNLFSITVCNILSWLKFYLCFQINVCSIQQKLKVNRYILRTVVYVPIWNQKYSSILKFWHGILFFGLLSWEKQVRKIKKIIFARQNLNIECNFVKWNEKVTRKSAKSSVPTRRLVEGLTSSRIFLLDA